MNIPSALVRLLAFTGMAGFLALQAQTPYVVLRVDVSNPGAVTFTATDLNSLVEDDSASAWDGVTLVGFFTGSIEVSLEVPLSTLTPRGTAMAYDEFTADDFVTPEEYQDLNFYTAGDESQVQMQLFAVNSPPFTGSATGDLSEHSALLPKRGSYGDVIVGWSDGGSNAVLGQWQVIPEPSAWGMAMLGVVGAAALCLRRRSRRE